MKLIIRFNWFQKKNLEYKIKFLITAFINMLLLLLRLSFTCPATPKTATTSLSRNWADYANDNNERLKASHKNIIHNANFMLRYNFSSIFYTSVVATILFCMQPTKTILFRRWNNKKKVKRVRESEKNKKWWNII